MLYSIVNQFHSCNFSVLKVYVDVARIKLKYLKTNQGTKLYLIKGQLCKFSHHN